VHEFQLGQRLELLDAMLPNSMVAIAEDQVASDVKLALIASCRTLAIILLLVS
jgi:hypothetical protein